LGIFVGYDDASKAYRVYNPITQKIVITRDIVFDESRFYNTNTEDLVASTFSKSPIGSSSSFDAQGPIQGSIDTSQRSSEAPSQLTPVSDQGDSPKNLISLQHASPNSMCQLSDQSLISPVGQGHDLEELEEWPTADAIIDISTQQELLTSQINPRGQKRPSTPIEDMEPLFRTRRRTTNPVWWRDYFVGIMELPHELASFAEAASDPDWVKAMEDKIDSIHHNKTWTLVQLPHGKSIISTRWLYKTKSRADGSLQKRKARLVA
jgi:hypothetical protein